MMFTESHPLIRRFIRFCALPYLFSQIDWNICTASKLKVIFDLLYIFFVLKYYPDNYFDCRFWEKDKDEWTYYYGSGFNAYTKARLNKEVQSPKHRVIFNDKYVCSQYFQNEANNPKIYSVINPNDNYQDTILKIFKNDEIQKLIIKPLTGNKGINIALAKKTKENIKIHMGNKIINLEDFSITQTCIIQEFIVQHELIQDFFKNSLNTIRILTMYTKSNDVIIISAFIRFGRGKLIVDNFSQGGIGVVIDVETGKLNKYGLVSNEINYRLTHHPDSKKEFHNFTIPYWDEVKRISKRIQQLCPFYRLLGLDIAITDSGPVLLEVNAHRCLAGHEAIAGPILKNKEALIAFSEYDLLINSFQKNLLKK
ncbi:MAG: sugar-transfer associated ATP-grasp domain-containing protein [Candidatus Thermoplasmatota archaeon]|nr:sugar-transfer associated ATP-grasp domain-containing protein [Candidatus Thermoplasmatota archaeon]